MGAAGGPGPPGDRPRVRGRDRRGRIQRQGLRSGRPRERRGTRRLRAMSQLHGRPAPSLRRRHGDRREPARCVRRAHRAARDERLAPRRLDRPRRGGDLRPVRQRGAQRAAVPGPRRGCADHRRRPDRADGGGGRAARGRALRRDHRREPVSARARAQDGRHGGARRPRRFARRDAVDPRHEGGLRRRPRDERQPGGAPRHGREPVARREHRACSDSPTSRSRSTGTP